MKINFSDNSQMIIANELVIFQQTTGNGIFNSHYSIFHIIRINQFTNTRKRLTFNNLNIFIEIFYRCIFMKRSGNSLYGNSLHAINF